MANVFFLNYKHTDFYLRFIVLVLNFLRLVVAEDACPDYEYNFMENDRHTFTKVELGSKYLYPTRNFIVNSISSESVCSYTGKYEAATVDNMTEFRHVVHDLIQDKQLNLFGISPSVITGEAVPGKLGVYTNSKTKKNITFHFFNLKDGQYFEQGLDCVAIEPRGDNYFYVPKQCAKGDTRNPMVIPVCQYPQQGKCQQEGIVTQNAENGTEFYKIGRYYGSRVQKPWEEAKKDCENRQMDLLHFSKTSFEANDHPWADILSNMSSAIIGPNEWFQAIWTAGKFKEKFGEDQEFEFILKDNKTSWSYKESLWKWSDAKLVKSAEEERCLAIVSTCPITIRSVSCELPNYYVCVERTAFQNALQFEQVDGLYTQQKSTCHSVPKRNYIRECDAKSWSPCECRKEPLCRYNGPSQRCEDEKYFCQRKLSFRPGECVRTGGFYMVGGSICQSNRTEGLSNCFNNESILAVNLFGPEVNKDGVKYRAGSETPFDDLYQIARRGEAAKDWHPQDRTNDARNLYGNYLWAEPIGGTRSNLDICITYEIPAKKPGIHELALKLADTSGSKSSTFNSFNVKFNNVRVLWEVDFTKFLAKEGGTVDLLLNYEIKADKADKKTLSMKAQPDTVIYDELIPLDICLSECQDYSVKNWQFRGFNISGFSVLQFNNSKKS